MMMVIITMIIHNGDDDDDYYYDKYDRVTSSYSYSHSTLSLSIIELVDGGDLHSYLASTPNYNEGDDGDNDGATLVII